MTSPQPPNTNLPRVGMSPLSARARPGSASRRPPSAGGLISNPNVIGALTTGSLAAAASGGGGGSGSGSGGGVPNASHPHMAALSAQRAASRDEKRASLKKLAALVLAPLDQPITSTSAAAGGYPTATGSAGSAGGADSISPVLQSLFPLAASDDHTYVSTLKADIYALQMRIEKLQRSAGVVAGSAAAAVSLSKRHSELSAIKHSTADVDAIVSTTKKPSRLKLRLLEFLTAAQIQLETLLTANQPANTQNQELIAPPLSRLPPYLVVADRMAEAQETIRKLNKSKCTAPTLFPVWH